MERWDRQTDIQTDARSFHILCPACSVSRRRTRPLSSRGVAHAQHQLKTVLIQHRYCCKPKDATSSPNKVVTAIIVMILLPESYRSKHWRLSLSFQRRSTEWVGCPCGVCIWMWNCFKQNVTRSRNSGQRVNCPMGVDCMPPVEGPAPRLTHGSLDPHEWVKPKLAHLRFSRLCGAHGSDQHADHATQSVAVVRIVLMPVNMCHNTIKAYRVGQKVRPQTHDRNSVKS